MANVNLSAVPWLSKNSVHITTTASLTDLLCSLTRLESSDFYLVCNGKRVDASSNEHLEGNVHIVPRLCGGKGGFGSMLRAIGAQIEKTTNREACRDLSGRRLRDINEERRLKNWIAQKEEREKEARERKRKRLERLCQEPKPEFKDDEYVKQRLELTENIYDSVEQGLKASTSGVKRKPEADAPVKKKRKGMLFDSDIDSDDSSEEEGMSDSEVMVKTETTDPSGDEKPNVSDVKVKSECASSDDEKVAVPDINVKLESGVVSVL